MNKEEMKGQKKLLRRMIIIDILYAAILSVAWFPAIFSPMLAAGGTSFPVYMAVYSLMAFPFVLAFSILIPWIFYALRMPRVITVLLLLPLINGCLILLYVVLPELLA